MMSIAVKEGFGISVAVQGASDFLEPCFPVAGSYTKAERGKNASQQNWIVCDGMEMS
jgi:hypothetical protein